jgi:hypothetical protein
VPHPEYRASTSIMLISDDPNNPGGRNAHAMLAAQLSRQRLDF